MCLWYANEHVTITQWVVSSSKLQLIDYVDIIWSDHHAYVKGSQLSAFCP